MIGVMLVVEAAIVLSYGDSKVRRVPVFLPAGHFRVSGTIVKYADLITFGTALVITIVLSAALRSTRRGLAMRAVVDDP